MLSDFSLAFGTSQAFLEGVLLVLDGGLKRRDSLLPLLLLVIDHLHQVVKLVLALPFVLPGHHLHVRLSIVNVCFRAKRLLQSINLECQGNQILFLPIKHMIPDAFRQCLVNVTLLVHFQVH